MPLISCIRFSANSAFTAAHDLAMQGINAEAKTAKGAFFDGRQCAHRALALDILAHSKDRNQLREHAMSSTTINSASDVRSGSASGALAQNWWLFTLRGILGIIFGCIALIFPGPTMLSLVILFSAYMLVDGVAGIIAAVRKIRRREDRWGLLIFEGLLNIAVAIAAFL